MIETVEAYFQIPGSEQWWRYEKVGGVESVQKYESPYWHGQPPVVKINLSPYPFSKAE